MQRSSTPERACENVSSDSGESRAAATHIYEQVVALITADVAVSSPKAAAVVDGQRAMITE